MRMKKLRSTLSYMNDNKLKSVVFLSNFFNHHQKPFSDAIAEILGQGYTFVETEEIPQERKNLGYHTTYPEYVIRYEKYKSNPQEVAKIVNEADAVIMGSAPESLIYERKRLGKLIFRYNERLLKKKPGLLRFLAMYFKLNKSDKTV